MRKDERVSLKSRIAISRWRTALGTALALGAALVLDIAAVSPAFAADDPAVGIWAYRWSQTPGLAGELSIVRDGDRWRATLAGAEVRFTVTGSEVRFAFPGDRGGFRGTLTGAVLEGFWIQPAGDPHGPEQSYASPLALRALRPGAWRGTVQPLDDRFTLYLKIYPGPDGTLLAAFRNPEFNSNGGVSLFQVTRDGDHLRIAEPPGPDAGDNAYDATLVHGPDRLQLHWSDLDRDLELVRRTPAEVPQFFPRPPGERRYAYRPPPVTGDGWTTARGREVGLDEAALTALVQKLIDADPASRRAPLIHSVLVARRGKLALEEYFFGFDRDTPHDLRSAGKTFASVMMGAAMRRGTPISPESKAVDVFAGLAPFAHPDPRKAKITLGQLLTHSSGLACNDNDRASPGREDQLWRQRDELNLWKYTLDLPMVHEPGRRYAYCSASINLVGGALATATSTWLPALFDRTVARPLQFSRYYWNVDRRGEGYLGGGAYVRPRDLLKLGQAYLDGGVWRGERIVDAAWVTRSTAPSIEISAATTGLDAESFQNAYIPGADGNAKDGLAWHIVGIRAGDRVVREYNASGNGGQLLFVIPELEMVVVVTAGNYAQGGIWNRFRNDLVGAQLIPAVRTEPAKPAK